MNFVVDDIVKGISDNYCITDMDMTRGRILSVHGDEIEVRECLIRVIRFVLEHLM